MSKVTYLVRVLDLNSMHWKLMGSIHVEPKTDGRDLETHLVKLGVYCPRGMDRTTWKGNASATIIDASDQVIVKLTRRDRP